MTVAHLRARTKEACQSVGAPVIYRSISTRFRIVTMKSKSRLSTGEEERDVAGSIHSTQVFMAPAPILVRSSKRAARDPCVCTLRFSLHSTIYDSHKVVWVRPGRSRRRAEVRGHKLSPLMTITLPATLSRLGENAYIEIFNSHQP